MGCCRKDYSPRAGVCSEPVSAFDPLRTLARLGIVASDLPAACYCQPNQSFALGRDRKNMITPTDKPEKSADRRNPIASVPNTNPTRLQLKKAKRAQLMPFSTATPQIAKTKPLITPNISWT